MSKRNYNKMYDKPTAEVQEAIEQEVAPVVETVVETAVEPEVVAPVAPIEEAKQPDILSAIVVDCAKLNVREEPSPKANVVAIIDASNEVVVYDSESFGNYYKVCTASGIEGYCVKDYLKLN